MLVTTHVSSWSPFEDKPLNRTSTHRLLDEPSFSRFDPDLFSSNDNASLYLPRLERRSDNDDSGSDVKPAAANETSGRSLDLDALLSGASSSTEERNSDEREGRIVNDGPKHEIQGFIPIISLKQKSAAPAYQPIAPIPHPGFQQQQQQQFESSYETMTQALHQQQSPGYPAYGVPEPPRGVFGGLGAALQSLKMKRKQGYEGADMVPGRDCLCVPSTCARTASWKARPRTQCQTATGSSSRCSSNPAPSSQRRQRTTP